MTFEVYSNRMGSKLTYTVLKTDTGWDIEHKAHSGGCDKAGTPHLYGNFHQDNIIYPNTIGDFMEQLWREIDTKQITDQQAQEKLQELAEWVTQCEINKPQWQGWNC